MKEGIELIVTERLEQIEKHGWTLDHDTQWSNGELCHAVKGLLLDDEMMRVVVGIPNGWDGQIWDKLARKSYKERLVIAGALIAAELDRINVE